MRKTWLVVAVAALGLGACKDKEVSVATVAKTPEAVSSAEELLAWTLPAGWREEAGQGMRYATLLAGPVGQAYEVTVVRLEGAAGGMLANVNRWRGQLGLPPTDEGGAGENLIRLPSAAGEILLVDLLGKDESGKQARMLAAIAQAGGSSWFFKMIGPKARLEEFAPQFKTLLRSLRPAA